MKMLRHLFISFMIIAASSCQTEALNEEIELNNQLIGITSAHNARQLGGYHIGRKKIKEDLLIRTASISGLSE